MIKGGIAVFNGGNMNSINDTETQLYRFRYDDYSAPSCTTFDKDYFGTLNDIFGFAERLKKGHPKEFEDLIKCFDRYANGDKNITHQVAYKEVPLLVRAKCLGYEEYDFDKYKWTHTNTSGYPYEMKCSRGRTYHVWVSCRGEYTRCIKAVLFDLKYKSTTGKYIEPGMTVGLPYQIGVLNNITVNRMYVVEKRFKDKAEALNDIQNFKQKPDPIFTQLLDDIFGDI